MSGSRGITIEEFMKGETKVRKMYGLKSIKEGKEPGEFTTKRMILKEETKSEIDIPEEEICDTKHDTESEVII